MKITPVDGTKEVGGIDREYYGVMLKIARANNTNFVREFKHETEALKRIKSSRGKVSADDIEKATIRSMAKTILVGWSNFTVDGKEVEYSVPNAVNLLENDADAREFISGVANDLDNFLDESRDELLGESAGQ